VAGDAWTGPGDNARMPSSGLGMTALLVAVGVLLLVVGGLAIWLVLSVLTQITGLA
jgi:hypothetical protein